MLRAVVSVVFGSMLIAAMCQPAMATAESCAASYLSAHAGATPSLGFAPSDLEDLIQRIANRIGLPVDGITITSCADGEVDKVQAWYSPGGEGHPPQGDYILYDPTWVKEVIGQDKVQATALFGHELGHLLGRHFTSNATKLTRLQKETYADHFAGCAVGGQGYDFSTLENLLKRIRPDVDGYYPSWEHAIAEARKGYDDCAAKPANLTTATRYLYFGKSSDGDRVVDVLKGNGLEYETATGDNDVASNLLTCTPDVPFDRVKDLATKLLRAGVELKAVGLADVDPMPSNRISIESYPWLAGYNTLTEDQVKSLAVCEPFRKKLTAHGIVVTNKCSLSSINVYVRAYSAGKGKWYFRQVMNLSPSEHDTITTGDSQGLRTDRPYYFYAEGPDWTDKQGNIITWGSNQDDNKFEVSPGRYESYRKSSISDLSLNCKKAEAS